MSVKSVHTLNKTEDNNEQSSDIKAYGQMCNLFDLNRYQPKKTIILEVQYDIWAIIIG
jgi:hypothetical protein